MLEFFANASLVDSCIGGTCDIPSYFTKSKLDIRKFLFESLIHISLEVRWFHIFYYSGL